MKASADRILYLSRVIQRKLKENMNLVQKADDEAKKHWLPRDTVLHYDGQGKELRNFANKVEASNFVLWISGLQLKQCNANSSCSRPTNAISGTFPN